jgi:hypothetical protein
MRYAMLLIMVTVTPVLDACSDQPRKKERVVRPAMWWSGLGRVSDGGGPALKATSESIADAEAFGKLWKNLGLKEAPPRVNFKDYFVVVVFRPFGLDFELSGGLAIDERGDAQPRGMRLDADNMNSGVYSTTIGVFPRAGIKSVEGKKLPAK